MAVDKHPVFAASNLTCPVKDCRGEMVPNGLEAYHHGEGRYRYMRVTSWTFSDRIDYPARCSDCGRHDVLIHFVAYASQPMTDKYALQSQLDAPLSI